MQIAGYQGGEALGEAGDAGAKGAGAVEIAVARALVRAGIAGRDGGDTDRTAAPIDIRRRAGQRVGGRLAEAHPDLAMLRGERVEIGQGRALVAIGAGRVGKATGELVLPVAGEPAFRTVIGEAFELPGRAAHVGRAAIEDGIGLIERLPGVVGQGAVFGEFPEPGGIARAIGHRLCEPVGMSISREVDDFDICHVGLHSDAPRGLCSLCERGGKGFTYKT